MEMTFDDVNAELAPAAPLGRRERKKRETRNALHQAALTLFAKNGFQNTRIGEIADAADVSESTFFRYFDSKEGVALEGIRRRAEEILGAVKSRPISETPIDACLAVNRGGESLRYRLDAADLPGLELLGRTPELASTANLILNRIISQLAEDFARRLGEDVFSLEVRLQAHAVVSAAIAALEAWIRNPGAADPQALAEQALTRLRKGFKAE